jgi:membrane-associated tyrosine/threonine-specific cdc2-inhibitory kinase
VEDRLGAGSFGEVFKVQSKEDGRYYAVKISRQGFRGELDRSYRLQEVNRHEVLKPHPNCVRFYRAWEEEGHLYIQTELCQQSLKSYCEQFHDPPDEAFVWQCLADLALGLRHIHDLQLGHFDIKPDNIFITSNGVCKIGDFGLMLDLSSSDLTEALDGDPKYLAPELLEGKFSKAADIFSLGLTMLELSCDVDLPQGEDLWHALREGNVPTDVTQDLSCELKKLILSMLNPEPSARPSIHEVLRNPTLSKIAAQRQRYAFSLRIRNYTKMWASQAWAQITKFLLFVFAFLWKWPLVRRISFSSKDTPSENIVAPGSEDSFHPQMSSSFTEAATPKNTSSHQCLMDPVTPNSRNGYTESPNRRNGLTESPLSATPFSVYKGRTLTSPLIGGSGSRASPANTHQTTLPFRNILFEDVHNERFGKLDPKKLLDAFDDVSD